MHRHPLVRRFGFLKVTPNLKNCGDNLPERCLMVNENPEAALTTICTPELDDAIEAAETLTDRKVLWSSADPGQRDPLRLG